MGLPERTGVVRGASVEERKGLAKGLDRKAGAEQVSIAELFGTCSWVDGDTTGL